MKKTFIAALAVATAAAGVIPAGVAAAQPHPPARHDRDHDGVPNRYDRHDDRKDVRRAVKAERRAEQRALRYYGGKYGYNGYQGRYRTGQRYAYYNNSRYYITDYRAYRLPPPQAGYRYYRADNGDIVMAAIATGVIGLIIGGALN